MVERVESEIVETAKLMIAGDLDLVRGCRALTNLYRSLHKTDREVFNPILAFESETEVYPLDQVRDTYERNYLKKVDIEIAEYGDRARPAILKACTDIITVFGIIEAKMDSE